MPSENISGPEKIDLNMLVAEDTPEMIRMLKLLLGRRYTSVEIVTNGKLLVEKLSDPNYNPDFILTDNTMPEMTGIEAIAKIRAMNRFKSTPIILYTTDTDGSLQTQASSLGAFFLSKPAPIQTLYTLIDTLSQKDR
jgi:CheY-like chemotaxis protein